MHHDSPLSDPTFETQAKNLCQMFNDGDYTDRLSAGQLHAVLINENHLRHETATAKTLPFCTVGKLYRYVDDDGIWHAEVHQYVKPNRQLGATGNPDPKRLRKDGKIWTLERPK